MREMSPREEAILLELAAAQLGMSPDELRPIWEEAKAALPELEAAYEQSRFAQALRRDGA